MKTVYYYEERPKHFSKSIFLAGPSPRSNDVSSWRPKALEILRQRHYDDVVYIPEFRNGVHPPPDYKNAPPWEHEMMDGSDVVLFWIPRDIETMPGFTTNVEFGMLANSGKVILGSPKSAHKMGYLKFMANKFHIPQFEILEEVIGKTLEMIGPGAERINGETEVPLHIWRLRAFQNWYQAQKNAGNRLDGARVEWIGHPYRSPDIIYILLPFALISM